MSSTASSQHRQTADRPELLEKGAIGLTGILMQALTHIGPAIGIATGLSFVVSLAGIAAPVVFFLAFLVVLTVGISITQLARQFPSAGGYFTWVSRTLHPRAGLYTAWISFLYDPLGGTINLAFASFVATQFLQTTYGANVPWWIFFLAQAAVVSFVAFRGIKASAKVMVALGIIEIAVVLALALFGVLDPGQGGSDLRVFNPAEATSPAGLYLGVVFSILSFSGFESVAPLAEESSKPKRNLPIAILASIGITGLFYVLSSWGLMSGVGFQGIDEMAASGENPLLLVAGRVGIATQWIVVVVILNSAIATCIACTNASTRVFYALGRARAFPAALGKLHGKSRTPWKAIFLQTIITIVYGLGLGLMIGPDQVFYVTGVFIGLGLVFIYSIGNVGVIRLYLGAKKASFNFFLHVFFPVISTVALLWVGYNSLVPFPSGNAFWGPIVFLMWAVAGGAVVWLLSRTGNEGWLTAAGQLIEDDPIVESGSLSDPTNER